jgi:DNA sulfur modification protein DndD
MNEEKTTLRQFFQNFLAQEKAKENISEEYLNFLKILWLGFDDFALKTKIQRKIYILEQIEKFLTDVAFQKQITEIVLPDQNEVVVSQNSQTPTIKLKEIDLINFRGFQANDDGNGRKVDFNEKATLFFAPNGGGKTSLCEALEWALTGDTSERAARQVDPIGGYFQNTNKSEPNFNTTKLILADNTVAIPNPIFDRCFLEKNRIEKFAKLAIQPSSKLQEVLGELFGFSDVVDFFKEFGQDLSPTDNEKNRTERENWRIWLDWSNKKIEQEKAVEEAKKEEKSINDELGKLIGDKSFGEKRTELEEDGKKLRAELEIIEKDLSTEFSTKDFLEKIKIFNSKITEWRKYEKNITDNAKKLDFESLFQSASIIFQGYKDNKCPLCDTPFEQSGGIFKRSGVVTDPRQKTEKELKKLKQLTDWKSEKIKLEMDLRGLNFRTIRDDWQKIKQNLIDDNWKGIAGEKEKPTIPEINFAELETKLEQKIKIFIEACETSFGADFSVLSDVEKVIIDYKKNKEEILKAKPDKEAKIQKLREEFTKLQDQNNAFSAKQQITKTNEEKLQKIIGQANNSDSFKKLLNVYPAFYESIQSFQSSSILKEGADIDDYATGFYRALNLYDHDGEKVKTIHFPKSIQEKFCVKYEKDTSKTCNALHLLSEGHLRTLGLASLLARAMKYAVPVLIFDDAINAIDSDHRDNIAFLLSGNFTEENGKEVFGEKWEQANTYLSECQFVITSHDRFFDEKIANLFKKDAQKRYVLYSGKAGIDFCEKGNPANFEAKIESFLKPETQDIRSAIFYCRIWLEEVCLKIAAEYKKVKIDGNIERIKFKREIDPRKKQITQPALEIVLSEIKDILGKSDCTEEQKKIAKIAEDIMNEKGNFPWFFEVLNQESHNRRFDHVNVSNAPTSKEVEKVFSKIQEINSICSAII